MNAEVPAVKASDASLPVASGKVHRRRVAALGVMASLLLGAGACTRRSPAPPGSTSAEAPINATAADVLKAVGDARGDVVLLNMWATWCEPCRHEFPTLLRLKRELAARNFRLILVSADFADQLPQVRQFLAQQGVGFPTYLKAQNDMEFINTLDPRWSGALPATFLYDPDGKLRDFWEGEASYEVIAGKVGALLGSAPQRGAEGGSR